MAVFLHFTQKKLFFHHKSHHFPQYFLYLNLFLYIMITEKETYLFIGGGGNMLAWLIYLAQMLKL